MPRKKGTYAKPPDWQKDRESKPRRQRISKQARALGKDKDDGHPSRHTDVDGDSVMDDFEPDDIYGVSDDDGGPLAGPSHAAASGEEMDVDEELGSSAGNSTTSESDGKSVTRSSGNRIV